MKYKTNFAPAEAQYAVEHETESVRNAYEYENNANKTETLGKTEVLAFETATGKDIAVEFNPETTDMWLNADRIATLFGRDVKTVNKHLNNALKEGEIDELNSRKICACSNYEGNRLVTREIAYYNFDAILSVGYHVKSPEGARFRKWATSIIKERLQNKQGVTEERVVELIASAMPTMFSELMARMPQFQPTAQPTYQTYQQRSEYDPYAYGGMTLKKFPEVLQQYGLQITQKGIYELLMKLGYVSAFRQATDKGKELGLLNDVYNGHRFVRVPKNAVERVVDVVRTNYPVWLEIKTKGYENASAEVISM